MKIAVAGKGGVGKTTVTALLAHHLRKRGGPCWLSTPTLLPAWDRHSAFRRQASRFAAHRRDGRADRRAHRDIRQVGGRGFFRLNPNVADLPERFPFHRGIRLLLLGRYRKRIGLHLPRERLAQGVGAACHAEAERGRAARPLCRRRASGARNGGGGGRDAGGGRAHQPQHADGPANRGARGGHWHPQHSFGRQQSHERVRQAVLRGTGRRHSAGWVSR